MGGPTSLEAWRTKFLVEWIPTYTFISQNRHANRHYRARRHLDNPIWIGKIICFSVKKLRWLMLINEKLSLWTYSQSLEGICLRNSTPENSVKGVVQRHVQTYLYLVIYWSEIYKPKIS